MRESLVGFSHAVYVFFLLDCGAFTIGGVQQFVAQLVDHAFFCAPAGVRHQPANSERSAAIRIYFHRNLIVRAADTPGLHFEQRLGVLDGLLEELQGFVSALLLHAGQGFVKDALGRALLALPHHRVDELRHQVGAINWIRLNGSLWDMSFTRHITPGFKVSMFQSFKRFPAKSRRNLETWETLKLVFSPSSAFSLHTSSDLACGWRRLRRQAFRESRDSARQADLSHGPRGSAQSSAPAGCV